MEMEDDLTITVSNAATTLTTIGRKRTLQAEHTNDLLVQQSKRLTNDFLVQQNKTDILHKQLFQKELTPSDVGKLNRLVIPKNYATKYFPRIDESMQGGSDDNPAPDVQLSFYDENMSRWNFRYCYWKSSQSFVFTRGWSRFVKQRQLKAKDTIRFYKCVIREGGKEAKPFDMIRFDRAENSDEIPQVNGDNKRIRLFGVWL